MPRTIDEARLKEQVTLDVSQPWNPVTGLPTKEIAVLPFPMSVYKHPKEPFRTIIHRNTRHEIVREEVVATEHLVRTVADEKELTLALKDGWVKKPYIPQTVPDPDAHLYEQTK